MVAVRTIGIIFIVAGLSLVGWFGFEYYSSMQSVQKLNGEEVVKEKPDDYTNPFIENEGEVKLPDISFQPGEGVATLIIPSIDLVFDVFMGTDDDVLAKGVGMYNSDLTTTPDIGGHTVLSGHRDSVFSPVGELEDGDSLYVRYQDIDYHYKIDKTWITDAEDRSVIVEKDNPTLTLSTCYPFHFIGSAPDRYIVEAELVDKGDLLDLDEE